MKQLWNNSRMQFASAPYIQITLSGNTKPTDGMELWNNVIKCTDIIIINLKIFEN